MIEKLSSGASNAVNVTTIVKAPKKLKGEEVINKALYATIALLLIAILSTFFVKELPGLALDLRNIALDAIWVIACSYTIGELFKRVFINKAKATEEYAEAKEMAKNAVNSLTPFELEHKGDYCKAYSEDVYNTHLNLLLSNISISKEEYMEKYKLLNYKELKAKYGELLPKRTLKSLANINKLKHNDYNPEFFNVWVEYDAYATPSQMFNVKRENRKNVITSAITSTATGFFSVTFAGSFIFSFSIAVLFMAIVKITSVIIFASLKANFGWNLVMGTEVGRFQAQVSEVKNLKHYCEKIKEQTK